ncbi:MAG: O-methyltransferase [Bryobacteraceae bacterium]
MRRSALAAMIVLALATAGYGQRRPQVTTNSSLPAPNTEAEKKILSVIDQMMKARTTYLSVPVSDGRMMRLLTESVNAKTVAEIGTSTGFSGLWFALALQRTGGKLITFEMDRGRAETARKHFDQAGVGGLVTIVQGDAHENVRKLKEPIDVAFIDADKEGYVDYLEVLLPLIRPGGLILAHNIGMSGVDAYVEKVMANPNLETVFFMDGGGLSISLKKR